MSKELIRLSDCSMVFDDDVILNNINLYIKDKEFLTLIGTVRMRQDYDIAPHWWVSDPHQRRCSVRWKEDQ